MKALLAAALLIGSVPAQAVTVESASGDWSTIPRLKFRGDTLKTAVVERILDLVKSGACNIPGQSAKKIDLTVPFLVHFDAQGAADRLVVSKLGCAEAEGVIGGALAVLVDKKVYAPSGENPGGWYRHQVSFSINNAY